jgi:hypothetical protein
MESEAWTQQSHAICSSGPQTTAGPIQGLKEHIDELHNPVVVTLRWDGWKKLPKKGKEWTYCFSENKLYKA